MCAMELSTLTATYDVFMNAANKKYVWYFYAYPTKQLNQWRVKAPCFSNHMSHTMSLKSRDSKGKMHIINFCFSLSTVKFHDKYALCHSNGKMSLVAFRAMVEKLCELSDAGNDIMCGDIVLLGKNEGSAMLVNIDLVAPSYADLDEPLPF